MNDKPGRIVVGYDGSEQASHAVEWAAAEALRRRSSLTVLYVADYGRFVVAGGGGVGTEWRPYLAEESSKLLVDDGVERARRAAPEVQVTGKAEVGRPVGGLIEASRDADLLVLGSRGCSELMDLVVGSVATAVATHAQCPVVLVRGEGDVLPGPEHPVVVGVDGSPAARAALVFAAETAREASAPLRVVCAWNVLKDADAWVGVDARVLIDRDALLKTERTAAQGILEAAADQVRSDHPDVAITTALVEDAPAAALLRAGADAGLVVVGTRGNGAISSLLLGSVSHAVVHASTRPVAVVRR